MRWKLLIVLISGSCIPVLLPSFLPIHDLPGHIARVEILSQYARDGNFSALYSAESLLLPNVAFDLVVLSLAQLLTVEQSVRLFIVSYIVLVGMGVACVQVALFGELTYSVIFGVMLVLNGTLKWGFLNYLFGIGVVLLALAAWIANTNRVTQMLVGIAAAIILIFIHLAAFGIYAICIAGWELDGLVRKYWRHGRVFTSAMQFIPAGTCFFLMRTASSESMVVKWVDHPVEKLEFIVRSLTTFVISADLLLVLSIIVLCILILMNYVTVYIHPSATLMLGLIFIAFFTLPFMMLGSYFLDARIPIAFFLMLAGVARLRVVADNARGAVLATFSALSLLRAACVTVAWVGYEAQFRALNFSMLGPGQVLFTAAGPRYGIRDWVTDWQPPLTFAAAYAASSGVFVPSVFADPRHQPLAVRPEIAHVYRLQNLLPLQVPGTQALRDLLSRLRQVSPFAETYVLVLRCRNLTMDADQRSDLVFESERACLIRVR